MAHFCQLDENNVVTQVIVVDNKDITDPHTGQEDEILGIAFCKKLLGGKWVQTSYNSSMALVTHTMLDWMPSSHQSLLSLGYSITKLLTGNRLLVLLLN
jgi:hypothetical protein